MDVLVLIIDSLRARSLGLGRVPEDPVASGLARLTTGATFFSRAFAPECWTLPVHMSLFTGLLPSEHGAHFQHMAYTGSAPTLAEIFAARGYDTEIATRNPVLDGSIPGVTRGFGRQSIVLSPHSRGLNPLSLMLAMSKPRFRRQIRASGFFNVAQRESREFVQRFAQTTVPADHDLMDHLLARMREHRTLNRRFFIVANLFDVHAPYPPRDRAIFRPWTNPANWEENVAMMFVLPMLGGHRYLEEGFSLRDRYRESLLGRYRDSIRLLDAKIARFLDHLDASGLRDDLLLVVTSDHGEAFGEHGLYLHDASVFDEHLHVPLWVAHPRLSPSTVDDCVSTRSLFDLLRRVALDGSSSGTMLDAGWRGDNPIALAEHFYYPHARSAPRHRRNLRAAIAGSWKAIAREGAPALALHDLHRDPSELRAMSGTVSDYADGCRARGVSERAITGTLAHLSSGPAEPTLHESGSPASVATV